jgi:hypothetical protein
MSAPLEREGAESVEAVQWAAADVLARLEAPEPASHDWMATDESPAARRALHRRRARGACPLLQHAGRLSLVRKGSPLLRPLLRCSSSRWRLGRGLPERCRRGDRRRGRQPSSLSVGTAASRAACPRLRVTEVPFEAQAAAALRGNRRRDGAIARDRESRRPGREPSAQAPLRPRGRFAPPCLEGLQPAHRSVREVPRPVHNASRFDTSGARTWTSRRP